MLEIAGERDDPATVRFNEARERDWEILLAEIDEGEVVPIIGHDLLTIERDGLQIDANEAFANELARVLGVEPDREEPPSVASVAAAFLEGRGHPAEIYEWMEHILRDAGGWESYPDSLRKLAEITPLRLFVTTTFDPWTERALTDAGRSVKGLAYQPSEQTADLPKDFEHLKEAFVYHLLGKAGTSAFAVTEEDILEFMHQLLSPGSPRRPDQLFDVLEKSHLLFLGCRFPDWLTRFLVRMARGVPLGDPHGRRNWVAGGTVRGSKGLQEFLTRSSQRTKIFQDLDAGEFVSQLHQRWKAKHPHGIVDETVTEAEARDKVFISYASENRAQVMELCQALDARNVLYWFDRAELKGGNDWDEKIRRNVRSCCLFVPLISEEVIGKGEAYVLKEWRWALDRQEMQPANGRFIVPVRLPGSPPGLESAEEIPLALQEINWMDMPDFLDQIVDFYRDKQRDRLDGLVAE
ncbi:MAG TPA: toll/interleukin-1 receptor domain-containing protein [Longimicrobiales bacterium]|nr:toll/interleukin-1 receptor domain-containing protein [Longimicrobiales bacterium]